MEMRFSLSVITAIEAVKRLEQGEFGKAPLWCNFRFPSRLKASPIERVNRNDPIEGDRIGSWDLARKVEFFYSGRKIATVFLKGLELDGTQGDNNSFWGVREIEYLPYLEGAEETETVFLGEYLTCSPR